MANNTDNAYFELKKHITNDRPFKLYEGELSAYKDCYIHWHREFEVIYVVSGHTRVTINNEMYHGNEGDLIFINKEAIHFIERMDWDKNIFRYKTLVFDMSYIDGKSVVQEKYIKPLLEKTKIFRPLVNKENILYSTIRDPYIKLAEECKKNEKYSDLTINSMLFTLIENMYKSGNVVENTNKFKENENTIKQVLAYINSHYSENIDTKILSEISGFSEGYLMHLFKKCAGKSIMEYVIDIRINAAIEKLDNTTDSIEQIASLTGFGSTSYFIKKFREVMKTTPLKYRNENKAE